MDIKARLVILGHKLPETRKHIRPILASLSKEAALSYVVIYDTSEKDKRELESLIDHEYEEHFLGSVMDLEFSDNESILHFHGPNSREDADHFRPILINKGFTSLSESFQ